MASVTLGNHTVYLNNAGQFAAVSPLAVNRSIGSGSLLCHRNGTVGLYTNVVRNIAPGGFVSGLGYCTIKLVQIGTFASHAGYVFAQSQLDLSTSAAGTAWALLLQQSSGGVLAALQIRATTTGISGLSADIVTTGFSITVAQSNSVTLVVRWVYSADLGGLWIRGYHALGTALPDFSDTATPTVETVVALGAPPTALGEGECVRHVSTSDTTRYSFDNVGRFPVQVGIL